MSLKWPKNEVNLEGCSRDYIREICRRYLAISAIARRVAAKIAARSVENFGNRTTIPFSFRLANQLFYASNKTLIYS
jgi:hypothetical protein